MNRIYRNVCCLLLALCLLLGVMGCQKEPAAEVDTPPADDTAQDTAVQEKEPGEILLSADFVLIRPQDKTDEELAALKLVWRALSSIYGGTFRMETDFQVKGEDDAPAYEILVGATNRAASQELLGTLSYKDWAFRVVDSHTIVICGGSPEATYAAACAFVQDLFGYTEDAQTGEVLTAGAAAVLEIGTATEYHHQNAVSSFKLGEHDIAAYSIVLSDKSGSEAAAAQIVNHFRALVGVELPVLSMGAYKRGDGGPAIFLGCTDENDTHLSIKPYSSDRYYIFKSGENIAIDYRNTAVAACAAARFIKECTPGANAAQELVVSFSEELTVTGLYIPTGTNSLDLRYREESEIAPGVVYEERVYFDPDMKPVRTYMITVAPGAASIMTALPGDTAKIGTYATMQDMVAAAADNGKNVVAGINADFFENTMLGVCVREGVELHGVSGRPWFGITKEGVAVLGAAEKYSKYAGTLACAVGGSNVVINDDYVDHISVDHEFGYTRHPRTAVGIKADGSIVLLVVDGRQSKISNGASLADLADILGSVGCINALNLDGGGSSTFVLTDGEGGFITTNSPSDGSLRSIADGLMVVLP